MYLYAYAYVFIRPSAWEKLRIPVCNVIDFTFQYNIYGELKSTFRIANKKKLHRNSKCRYVSCSDVGVLVSCTSKYIKKSAPRCPCIGI